MLSLTPHRPRRLTRPSAPSCRGGASSLLRLAQPGQRASDFSGWMHRAAALLDAAAFGERAPPSIITLLAPSRELAAHS